MTSPEAMLLSNFASPSFKWFYKAWEIWYESFPDFRHKQLVVLLNCKCSPLIINVLYCPIFSDFQFDVLILSWDIEVQVFCLSATGDCFEASQLPVVCLCHDLQDDTTYIPFVILKDSSKAPNMSPKCFFNLDYNTLMQPLDNEKWVNLILIFYF